MGPAEIQQQVEALRSDPEALRTFLQTLSPGEYSAWVTSAARINKVGGGTVETLLAPAAGLVAPAVGLAGGTAGLVSGLGALVGPTRAATMLKTLGPIGENTVRVLPAGRQVSPARILKLAGALGVTSAVASGIAEKMTADELAGLDELSVAQEGEPDRGPAVGGAQSGDAYLEGLRKAGYIPVPGRPGVFFNPLTGDEYDANPKAAAGSGNDGSAWGSIAESRRQFDLTQARLAGRDQVGDQQWKTSYDEGIRQFQATYDRGVFTSDRAYQQAADQFAAKFAEDQRQFDTRLSQDAAVEAARLGLSAEQMAAEQSRFDRQSSLAEQQNRQEVLRRPSDFISRAFEARGETSPTARITHTDLINSVASEAAAARAAGAASVENARRLAASVPKPPPRLVIPPPSTLVGPAAGGYAGPVVQPTYADVGGGSVGLGPNGQSPLDRPGTPDFVRNAPRMAQGGMTQANMVMTGDSPKGQEGKENEELVIDMPNDGGLMVIPKSALIGKRKRMADAAPHAATGGYFDTQFTAPGTSVNQGEIEDAARRFAPPAVRDLVGGGRIASFRPAVPALSPRRIGFLNSGEQDALNSYLGVVENTTLQDELGGMQSTFGPVVSRQRSRFAAQS